MNQSPLILDLEGFEITAEERQLLQRPSVGGVILFSRNIDCYDQLVVLTQAIREIRTDLLICVDQEGGRVQRCRDGFTRIPPMQVFDAIYRENPQEALQRARDCGWLLAAEVIASGIDFSFTPVLDVDDEFCSVIGDRSFSADPSAVTALGNAFIEGAQEAGMKVTGKHFPGHGSVRGDSHLELPVDSRPLEAIEAKDLIPFAAMSGRRTEDGSSVTMDAVMPAHILFPDIDPQQPVGFSRVWLEDILRNQLRFDGVIFSDDLTMEGAAVAGDFTQRTRLALSAGCDVILVCNNREGAVQVADFLESGEFVLDDLNLRGLERMRPSRSWGQSDLHDQRRWQETRDWLVQLC